MDLVDFLEDNIPAELNKLLPLDFKKFIKLKKGLTNKELRKLLLRGTITLLIYAYKRA